MIRTFCIEIRLLLLLLLLAPPAHAQRVNLQITIGASPVRIASIPTRVNRLFIQSRHSNAGLVYILLDVPVGTTCNASDSKQLTAELGPGDSTHPGASFSDPQGANGDSPPDYEDMGNACIAGTNAGDLVIVSYYQRT